MRYTRSILFCAEEIIHITICIFFRGLISSGNKSVGNYYKMVAQFKDGKMRVIIFDDGNTYVPASETTAPVTARSSHYVDLFKNRKEWKNKGMFQKPTYRLIKGYIQTNQEFFNSLESEIKKSTLPVLQDDW